MAENKYVKSPLNYTGGKYKLLPQILPLFPQDVDNFVDMFCGGGNVGVNVNAKHILFNDNSDAVIGILRLLHSMDYKTLNDAIYDKIIRFGLSDSANFGHKKYLEEGQTHLGYYNKNAYMSLRQHLNTMEKGTDEYYLYLYVTVLFAFNTQIRFNSSGEFNMPVGKQDYNSNIKKVLERFTEKIKELDCEFTCKDFRDVARMELTERDMVYCDPPYLISCAVYNERNGGWTEQHERNLLNVLDDLNERGVRFALSNVTHHKGRTNDLLIEWSKGYYVHELDFGYKNCNYHAKHKGEDSREVLITNY
jgi:DNA adenine methylase Dam